MNIYDFDGTIYEGDSSVDFFKYCLKRNPRCAKILPAFGMSVLLYLLKRRSKEEMKSAYFRFVTCFEDIHGVVTDFWVQHEGKLKDFYLRQKCADDLIISASPDFLLQPICDRLGVSLIASRVDPTGGVFQGKNCHGEEKVRRFYKVYPDGEINDFYSDSYSDDPLARISKRAILVKGERLLPWQKN